MKNFTLILLSVLILFSCFKDDSYTEPVNVISTHLVKQAIDTDSIAKEVIQGIKNGIDTFGFLGSGVFDNVGMGGQRIFIKYNHEKVAYYYLVRTGQSAAQNYTHNTVKIKFKDSTSIVHTAYIRDTYNNYSKVIPTKLNLRAGHTGKIIIYKQQLSTTTRFNTDRGERYAHNHFSTFIDGVYIINQLEVPILPTEKQFKSVQTD